MAQPGPLLRLSLRLQSRCHPDLESQTLLRRISLSLLNSRFTLQGTGLRVLVPQWQLAWRLPLSLSYGLSSFIRASTYKRQRPKERQAARELYPLPDLRSGVQNACCASVHQEPWPRPDTLWGGTTEALNGGREKGSKGTHMKMLPTQLCGSPGLGTELHMNTGGNMRSVERSNRNDNNNSTIVPFVSQCKVHKVLS